MPARIPILLRAVKPNTPNQIIRPEGSGVAVDGFEDACQIGIEQNKQQQTICPSFSPTEHDDNNGDQQDNRWVDECCDEEEDEGKWL